MCEVKGSPSPDRCTRHRSGVSNRIGRYSTIVV